MKELKDGILEAGNGHKERRIKMSFIDNLLSSFTKQYGEEKGKKVFYATTAKMAMKKK